MWDGGHIAVDSTSKAPKSLHLCRRAGHQLPMVGQIWSDSPLDIESFEFERSLSLQPSAPQVHHPQLRRLSYYPTMKLHILPPCKSHWIACPVRCVVLVFSAAAAAIGHDEIWALVCLRGVGYRSGVLRPVLFDLSSWDSLVTNVISGLFHYGVLSMNLGTKQIIT